MPAPPGHSPQSQIDSEMLVSTPWAPACLTLELWDGEGWGDPSIVFAFSLAGH